MQEFKERCDAEIRNGERPQDERGDHRGVVAERHAGDRHGQGRPRRPQQGDADDRPLGQGAGIQIRVYRRAGGKPLPLAAGRRVARRHGGGAAPVLRGAHPAKVEATISYAEMRFKWGNMEFSRRVASLREIDPEICQADFGSDTDDARPHPLARRGSAFGHRRTAPPLRLPFPAETAGCGREQWRRPAGQQPRPRYFGGRPSDGESGLARRFARAAAPRRPPAGASRPGARPGSAPLDDGMRRIGVRQAADGGVPPGSAMPVSGDYTVGSASSTPSSAWVSCSASRPSPPTTSWSWPSMARAKRPCWPNSPN